MPPGEFRSVPITSLLGVSLGNACLKPNGWPDYMVIHGRGSPRVVIRSLSLTPHYQSLYGPCDVTHWRSPELGSRSERVATPEFWRTYRGPGTSGWPCVSFHKSTGPSQNWQPKNRGVRDKLGQWFTTGQGGLPLLEALFKYTLIYIHSTPPNNTSLKVRVRMYKDKSLTSIY